MNLIPKERVVYSNYDLWETYPDDLLKEIALECEWVTEDDEITDEMLCAWRYQEDEVDWDCAWSALKDFFDDKTVIFFGSIGLWHGVYNAGKVGDFEKLFCDVTKDCDYIKFYDENGHLYLHCSHHDGSHTFEIKILTKKGEDYFDRWAENWNDNRTESEVHTQIIKRYSMLPNFVHKEYGCAKREYEPQSKERFVSMLNNKATSNYYPNGYAM